MTGLSRYGALLNVPKVLAGEAKAAPLVPSKPKEGSSKRDAAPKYEGPA